MKISTILIITFIPIDLLGKFFILAEQANDVENTVEEQSIKVIEPENAEEIFEKIFTGYNKRIRPDYKVKPITIQVFVGISSINYISEENMEFQAAIYVRQLWRDSRLAFGNDNTSVILQGDLIDKIWLPDTYIDNARKSVIDKENRAAFVTANGTVYYTYRATIIILSRMNFVNYPMDVQSFKIQFYSYAHDVNKIIYDLKSGKLFNHDELGAKIFGDIVLLTKKYRFLTGIYSCVIVQFNGHRRLGYFIMQFYFPCILCAVVSWLPFWMDRYEIGDRVSLGMTTLLTEVFLSQYINSAMPRVSYIKAADEFLLVSFIFILTALIESVIVYNVRSDVREKKKKQKALPACQGKQQENKGFAEDIPFSITQVFETQLKQTESNDVYVRSRDMDILVDKVSRVFFPSSYVLFVAYYFGRYVVYDIINNAHAHS